MSPFGVDHQPLSKGLPRALRVSKPQGLYGQHRKAANTYGQDQARMMDVPGDRTLASGSNQRALARRVLLRNQNLKRKKRVLP